METKTKTKINWTSVGNFLLRYSLLIALFLLSLFLTGISTNLPIEFKPLILVIGYESMALFLCGIAHFVYTQINFTKENPNILGYIFIGVHLLVSITVGGTYWLEFITKVVAGG
jgi:hypothetical protein